MISLYEKIVSKQIPSFVVYEDDNFIAFLTPFANTAGHTVVTAKVNPGANLFELSDTDYSGLLLAAKIVAAKLKTAFGVDRVGMVVDGTGVPHAHVQLIPYHGYEEGQEITNDHVEFNETFPGYVTSLNGPKMDDTELEANKKRIIES